MPPSPPSRIRASIFFLLASLPASIPAQWSPTNGPAGKGIQTFAADGTTLYISTDFGMNSSDDLGASWREISLAWHDGFQTCMAAKAGTVFLGTNQGFYRYTGNGTTWLSSNAGMEDSSISSMALGDTGLLAGTNQGHIYRSVDQGDHWTRINNGAEMGIIYSLAIEGRNIHAGGQLGLFRSPDEGVTWIRSSDLPGGAPVTSISGNGNFMFAMTGANLFRSQDHGATWTPLETGASKPGFSSLDANGPRLYATNLTDGLFRSLDNGNTWSRDSTFFNLENTSTTSRILAVGDDLFAATSHGIYRSSDQGSTWKGANTGIGIWAIAAMASLDSGRILASTNYGLYGSSDAGANWAHQSTFKVGWPTGLLAKGSSVFAFSRDLGIFRSRDFGISWQWKFECAPGLGGSILYGSDLYVGTGNSGILRSRDDGETWEEAGIGFEGLGGSFAICEGNLYAISSNGLFRFDAQAESWIRTPTDLPSNSTTVLAAEGNTLVVGSYSDGVFRSIDKGLTWSHPLAYAYAPKVTCFAIHGSDIYVGSDAGVGRSTNHGATWTSINLGLKERKIVLSMMVHGNHLYAGIGGEGIWKRSFDDIASSLTSDTRARGNLRRKRVARLGHGTIGFVRAGREDREMRWFDPAGRLLPAEKPAMAR